MLETVLQYLAPGPGSVILEATAGLGGHTGMIAERLSTGLTRDRALHSIGNLTLLTQSLGGLTYLKAPVSPYQ